MFNICAKCVLVIVCFLVGVKIVQGGKLTTTSLSPQSLWNATFTDMLRHDLLLNYDKFARPHQHYNATTVTFGISLNHIDLDEFKSIMNVQARLNMRWEDAKLKWNASDYGGIKMVHMADHEIWQPDIYLYNSANGISITHYANVHCLVWQDGQVQWVPPTQISVLCNMDLKYWPFDVQYCNMNFGSWTYHGDEVNLTITESSVNYEDLMVSNSEWNLKHVSIQRNIKSYPNYTEHYINIYVNLTLERQSPTYKAIIVAPAFAIIVLALAVFWLPPQASEKIILNGATAIIICLFLLYFVQKVPALGTNAPLIVVFYSSSLYIVSFSMIGSVLVLWLSRTKHTTPLPWVIRKALTGKLGTWLGLQTYIQSSSISTTRITTEEMRDHQVTDFDDHSASEDHHIIKSSIKPSMQQDWVLLAAFIDRISFCFYTLIFTVLAIAYSV